jgi:hypothetical protein
MRRKSNEAMTLSFGFNQILDTDIGIPGAISCDGNTLGDRFMRINTGTICPSADAPLYARKDQALIFTASKVASYDCTADSIEVNPFTGADADWVSGLLIATAIPAALWMQGRFVLHAAAIVPKGASRAIAIAGASGAGKTVLAKQLLDQGANLLADDSVALELTDSGFVASGLPGGIHRRIDTEQERRFENVSPARSVKSAPLGAIIFLDGFAGRAEARRLDKIEAIEKTIAHQHRPSIPSALGRVGAVLAQAASIAERVPVGMWQRRKDELSLSAIEQEMLTALLES